MRALVAYNPSSGRFPSRWLVERAVSIFKKEGWQIRIEETRSSEHITELAREAAENRLDVMLVAGGDGSLNLAAQGLVGSDTALGVLPSGTANVWAQELGLPWLFWLRPTALEESARRLARGRTAVVDVGVCNERIFLLWAGVGLDAFVVHHIEPRPRWVKYFAVIQYAASTIWHASYWHGVNLDVEVDGQHLQGHFLLALASNVHLYIGGMAELTPDARLDDGEMDLWLFEGNSFTDTLGIVWGLLSGRHKMNAKIHCIPFQRAQLISDSRTYIQVDGEPVHGNGPVNLTIQRNALRILIPEKVPRKLLVEENEPELIS